MRRPTTFTLLSFLAFVLLLLTGPQRVAAQSLAAPGLRTASPAPAALDGYEQQLLTLVARARELAGVGTTQLDAVLVQAARLRSLDMAGRGYFSHYTPEGTTFFDILDRSGLPWTYAGEVIARNNYPDDQTAVVAAEKLLTSALHRAVILDARYSAVGVGHAVDRQGLHYYTVIFLQR